MDAAGPAPETLDDVGAVVVAHARLDLALSCVASLRRWLPPERIVVVLNVPAAVDEHERARVAAEARLLAPPAPQGYGANLNLGVGALPHGVEFCVLANDDVVFVHDSLPRLVAALRRDRRAAVAGPQLTTPAGRPAVSYAAFPRIADEVRRVAVLPGPLWRRAQRRATAAGGQDAADWVVGAALVVRLESFGAVGGFDEDFFLNFEETDFCYRLREAGWHVVWCPEATVVHEQGASISRTLNYESFYAGLRLFLKKRTGPVRWPFLELGLVALFAAGGAYAGVASVLRPTTARQRLDQLRLRWRERVFLRSSPPREARR